MRACGPDPADERGRDRAGSEYLPSADGYATGSADGLRGARVSSRRNGEVRRERAEVGPPTLSMASDDGLSRACAIRSADRPVPAAPGTSGFAIPKAAGSEGRWNRAVSQAPVHTKCHRCTCARRRHRERARSPKIGSEGPKFSPSGRGPRCTVPPERFPKMLHFGVQSGAVNTHTRLYPDQLEGPGLKFGRLGGHQEGAIGSPHRLHLVEREGRKVVERCIETGDGQAVEGGFSPGPGAVGNPGLFDRRVALHPRRLSVAVLEQQRRMCRSTHRADMHGKMWARTRSALQT